MSLNLDAPRDTWSPALPLPRQRSDLARGIAVKLDPGLTVPSSVGSGEGVNLLLKYCRCTPAIVTYCVPHGSMLLCGAH